jgi:tetratricopeptide (TPR) repeat protein
MFTAIKPFRPAFLWLSLGMTWMLIGCGLLKYPPLNLLDFQKSKPDAYARGVQYYRGGLYKSAVKELGSIPPGHAKFNKAQDYLKRANNRVLEAATHVNYALEYRDQGELFKAKKELEGALEVYPKHRKVHMLLAALDQDIEATVDFYYDAGQEQLDDGNYEEARKSFLAVLKADPEDNRALTELTRANQAIAQMYMNEGLAFFENGNFNEAIKKLEKSFELNSADPALIGRLANVYNRRALKYYSEEKLSFALTDLKRSLEIKPDQEEIQRQSQRIQEKLGLLEKIGR